MEVTIGDYSLVESCEVLLTESNEFDIKTDFKGRTTKPVRLKIRFKEETNIEPRFDFESINENDNEVGVLIFTNWNDFEKTRSKAPIRFYKGEKEYIYFNAIGGKVGESDPTQYQLLIQFLSKLHEEEDKNNA